MDPKLGRLKKVDIRSVWPHEASHFTPWLVANLDKVGDVLGMELELIAREAEVGNFSVDILALDLGSGKPVVIENQFGQTDHNHLGQLLTYAAGYDVAAVVWISEVIRDEHRQALDWLNQRTDQDTLFFGMIVELLQIDDSSPAFNLKPIVIPNDWQKSTHRKVESAPSPRAQAYQEFFSTLIDELREEYAFTGARRAQPANWYAFASGSSGISYGVTFRQGGKACVELWIDLPDREVNKEIFDKLLTSKSKVEGEIGTQLEWERLDESKSSRIAIRRDGSIDEDEETLNVIREWMIDYLLKYKKAFSPHLRQALA